MTGPGASVHPADGMIEYSVFPFSRPFIRVVPALSPTTRWIQSRERPTHRVLLVPPYPPLRRDAAVGSRSAARIPADATPDPLTWSFVTSTRGDSRRTGSHPSPE